MNRWHMCSWALTVLLADTLIDTAMAQSIQGTAWNAVELYGTTVTGQSNADRQPHLVFSSDGRMSGADGCNRLTGPYTLKENGITFGQTAGTQMACPGTEDMATRFRAALMGTSHWSIVKGRLQFYGATGKPLAIFEPRSTTSAISLEGTTWQLVTFQGGDDRVLKPDDPAKYTIGFVKDRSLTARIDCNRGRGTWKMSPPSQLEFGPLVLTRAKCPDGSLHDQIVKQWTSVRSFVIRGGHLFLALLADGGIYEFAPVVASAKP
jgi:heat shock protein HslJ